MKINNKRLTILIAIGLALAVTIPIVYGLVVSNVVTVTINPEPNIELKVDRTDKTYENGANIVLTAILHNVPDGTVIFEKDGQVIGDVPSVSGVATLTTQAVNTGSTPITADFKAKVA